MRLVKMIVGAGLIAASLASSAFADTPANAPLAAGKPAGVKQAQMEGSGLLLAIAIGGVVAAAVVLATDTGGSSTATSTSSTTP